MLLAALTPNLYYAGHNYAVGEPFEASEEDAGLLKMLGSAEDAPDGAKVSRRPYRYRTRRMSSRG